MVLGFFGLIPSPTRPISTVGNPLVSFVHFAPPSVDLKTPLSGPPPINWPTWRRRCSIATYNVSGFFGAITMSVAPLFSVPGSTFFHVAPPSVVLNSPRSPPPRHSGPIAVTWTTLQLRRPTRVFGIG